MAEAADRKKQKQRAFFGRKDRLKKEAGQSEQQTAEQVKFEQAHKAKIYKQIQDRRDASRLAEYKADQQRRAEARRKAADSRQEFSRKADDRRAADAVRAETQRRAQAEQYARRQEQQRRDALSADERKKLARDLRHERQAMREVRQQEQQAQANMVFRQRQETNELRAQHKAQRRGLASEIEGHERDYMHKVGEIDVKERRTLAEFDNRRGTIRGRLDELRRGRMAVEIDRDNLQAGFDRERIDQWSKLERLKDRLVADQFTKPIAQALERKAMIETHTQERMEQQQRHERVRPQAVAARKLAHDQAHERHQQQRQEARQERAAGLSHEFSRSRG